MNRKNKNLTKHELNCNQKHKPCTVHTASSLCFGGQMTTFVQISE